jgi:hypothetical protein
VRPEGSLSHVLEIEDLVDDPPDGLTPLRALGLGFERRIVQNPKQLA